MPRTETTPRVDRPVDRDVAALTSQFRDLVSQVYSLSRDINATVEDLQGYAPSWDREDD